MAKDKYSAVWVSHTSISDFLTCPRSYYLKNVYRSSKTNRKMQLMSPPLALGQAVHEVVESLSTLKTTDRFREPLMVKFETAWKKVTGKAGGFLDEETENIYKNRGKAMLRRITKNPGPLARLAVKIQKDLPYFWLSEEENIILCGKIDWLEYLPETNSVHIIDFKTSKGEENEKSLQLPIYHLLVHYCQHRTVEKASYWYLERDEAPLAQQLPDIDTALQEILNIAQRVKLARKLNNFKCQHKSGCYACRSFEAIIKGYAEFVGVNDFNQDIYILDKSRLENNEQDSLLL